MLTEQRKQEVILLCQSLVQLKSYSGDEQTVAQYIQTYAKKNQFDDIQIDEYGNVLLYIKGNQPGPTILFDGHIDTVPVQSQQWTVDPFAGMIKDGKIYGRGTSDMKGAVSAMITAGLHFAKDTGKHFPGTIVISCSVHEECFEGVATRKVSERVNPDVVVIGESTHLQLNRGQRGRAEIIVETTGKTAHSSNPEKGINAVQQMMKLLNALDNLPINEHDILGKGILELTDIISSPYPGASVVPSQCKATFDRRLLVGETKKSVLEPIQQLIRQLHEEDSTFQATVAYAKGEERCYTGSTISDERYFPAWLYNDHEGFVQLPYQALKSLGLPVELSHYSFCTNGSHFAGEKDIPTIGFGPSKESLAHIDDEYIEVDQLIKATAGYAAIMEAYTSFTTSKREEIKHV